MSRKVPIFLEPSKSRKIVVFGGGNVALRKCRQFEGFYITVVADRVVPEMEKACDEIILEHFDTDDLSKYIGNAFIVVAATDSKQLNAAITAYARNNGCLINSAHGGGDILLPSSVRREGFTIAVSSEGSVPAFPPYLAKQIDSLIGHEYELMMKLLVEVRKGLQERVSLQPKRAEYLAEILASEEIWDCLKEGKTECARSLVEEIETKYRSQ